jgi:hypothetical protein
VKRHPSKSSRVYNTSQQDCQTCRSVGWAYAWREFRCRECEEPVSECKCTCVACHQLRRICTCGHIHIPTSEQLEAQIKYVPPYLLLVRV